MMSRNFVFALVEQLGGDVERLLPEVERLGFLLERLLPEVERPTPDVEHFHSKIT